MAVKAGQILHSMSRTVIDRIQTAGPGDLNIPTEKIYELGNFQTVATVRDIPDLSFNLDVLDVDTEVEALLTGSLDPGSAAFGDGSANAAAVFDMYGGATPVNIISPWKSAQGAYDIITAVAITQLSLESASYSYGLQDNAGETFTLAGDSIFYIPGAVHEQIETGDNTTTNFSFTVTFDMEATPGSEAVTALKYVETGVDVYALSVSVDGVRQIQGEDYTDVGPGTGISFTTAPATDAVIKIVFGFDPSTLTDSSLTYPQSVHEGVAVKPAAIRGKDIDLYVAVPQSNGTYTNSGTAIPVRADFKRWTDVQSFNLDWSVTLEDDFEFGNPRAVLREPTDVPEVSGSVEFRHRTAASMLEKIREITGITDTTEIIGPQSARNIQVMLQLKNPEGHGTTRTENAVPLGPGDVLKTLYVPDARFVLPGYEGQVQQKLNQTMNFDSDGGILRVMRGDPTDAQFMDSQGNYA